MPPLFQVERLSVRFGETEVVHQVSFAVEAGQTLGILGESGSGKTISTMAALRLLEHSGATVEGQARFEGRDLLSFSWAELRSIRGPGIGVIFQDPSASLDPTWTVGAQLSEAILAHQRPSRRELAERRVALFRDVGIPAPEDRLQAYPHQLSGGLKQRAMIAIALASEPKLLVADEPTSALDLSVQAQILQLLLSLKRARSLSLLLITHDLALAGKACDELVVMESGRVVESGPAKRILSAPSHPCTKSLLVASA